MELFTIIIANVWDIRQKQNHRICSIFIIDWPLFQFTWDHRKDISTYNFYRLFCQTFVSAMLLEFLSRTDNLSFKISNLSFVTSNLWKCLNKLAEGMIGGDKDSFSRLHKMSTMYKIMLALSKEKRKTMRYYKDIISKNIKFKSHYFD